MFLSARFIGGESQAALINWYLIGTALQRVIPGGNPPSGITFAGGAVMKETLDVTEAFSPPTRKPADSCCRLK